LHRGAPSVGFGSNDGATPWLIRHGERYQTITGKDYRPRRIDLGAWRYLACAICLLLVFLITGVPFLMMLYASLLPFYQAPSADAFESMSLANYATAICQQQDHHADDQQHDPRPVVASVVILIVALISYFVHKTKIAGRKILDFLGLPRSQSRASCSAATFFWFYLLCRCTDRHACHIGLAYLTKYMPVRCASYLPR